MTTVAGAGGVPSGVGAGGGRGGAGRRTRRRWELKRRDGGEDDERRGAGDEEDELLQIEGTHNLYRGRPFSTGPWLEPVLKSL